MKRAKELEDHAKKMAVEAEKRTKEAANLQREVCTHAHAHIHTPAHTQPVDPFGSHTLSHTHTHTTC